MTNRRELADRLARCECEAAFALRAAEDEIERLLEGGRYVTLALRGVANMGQKEEMLFEHVCKQWPEFDPRKPSPL